MVLEHIYMHAAVVYSALTITVLGLPPPIPSDKACRDMWSSYLCALLVSIFSLQLISMFIYPF